MKFLHLQKYDRTIGGLYIDLIKDEELEYFKKEIEREFKNDPALQQIHIARKIISMEARERGLSFTEFIKEEIKKLKE